MVDKKAETMADMMAEMKVGLLAVKMAD